MSKFLFLAALALGLVAPSIQASTLAFSLQPSQSGFQVNDSFDVNLIASGITGDANEQLLGFGLNVAISDTNILQLTGYALNPLFEDLALGTPTISGFAFFPGLDSSSWYGQALTLATFHLQALSAGQAQLAISSLADVEQNQGLIFLNQPASAIYAQQDFAVSSVPLPGSLLMFLSGLGILARRFGRKAA